MITYETYCQIRLLHDQRQLTAAQIAAELQLDIKTVEKWISQETFAPRKSPKRSSKLDAFKHQIIALLDRHPYTPTSSSDATQWKLSVSLAKLRSLRFPP